MSALGDLGDILGIFEGLGIDEASVERRGISLEDAVAGVLGIATRRAHLCLREGLYSTEDLEVAAWLLCFLPNWPKPEAYRQEITRMLPLLLARASVDEEGFERASRLFRDEVLKADPEQIVSLIWRGALHKWEMPQEDALAPREPVKAMEVTPPALGVAHISVKEASQRYGLSESWIRRLLQKGTIRGHKAIKKWLVEPFSLEEYLRYHLKPGPKKP